MIKALGNILALFLLALTVSSCIKSEQSPGYEYMPDMYRSPAVEAYVDYGEIRDTIREELALSISARKPADGTVPMSSNAMNDMPYTIPNTMEGYALAGEVVKSPFPQTEEYIEMGKEIYTNFCIQCHGKEGQGNGPVVVNGGHPAPQAYNSANLKTLPEGKMFHTLTYGKGAMGSHASQLTKEERWKVVAYVKHLQKLGEEEDTEEEEETTEIKG
jgi:mono/diheme cytochrome c family protein